jgi:hypothetical protein
MQSMDSLLYTGRFHGDFNIYAMRQGAEMYGDARSARSALMRPRHRRLRQQCSRQHTRPPIWTAANGRLTRLMLDWRQF